MSRRSKRNPPCDEFGVIRNISKAFGSGDPERGECPPKGKSWQWLANDLTRRSLEIERANGRLAERCDESVEGNNGTFKRDFCGFADILSIDSIMPINILGVRRMAMDVLFIQVTTRGKLRDHEKSIFAGPPIRGSKTSAYDYLIRYLEKGCRFAIRAWFKQPNGRWDSEFREYTIADVERVRAGIIAGRRGPRKAS